MVKISVVPKDFYYGIIVPEAYLIGMYDEERKRLLVLIREGKRMKDTFKTKIFSLQMIHDNLGSSSVVASSCNELVMDRFVEITNSTKSERKTHFSFGHKPTEGIELQHDIQNYIKTFEKRQGCSFRTDKSQEACMSVVELRFPFCPWLIVYEDCRYRIVMFPHVIKVVYVLVGRGLLGLMIHDNLGSSSVVASSCNELVMDRVVEITNSTESERKTHFSFGHKPTEGIELQYDIKNYIKTFEKDKGLDDIASERSRATNYNADAYGLLDVNESLLFEKVFFKNRQESGSLHICGGVAVPFLPLAHRL
ncbi:hypothetical protein Tco_1406785 [Tanacetum coccineum]